MNRQWGWLTTARCDWKRRRPFKTHRLLLFRIRPCCEPTKGLAHNHSLCKANFGRSMVPIIFWDRSGGQGQPFDFRNATALIQMGDWCESAGADRQPKKRSDGCERIEAASTKVSAEELRDSACAVRRGRCFFF